MKVRAAFTLAIAAFLLSVAAPVLAQDDEEGRYSIGLGAGMVQTSGSSDPYFTANLRSRIGYRTAGDERQGSVFGFVEPEVGYWTRDSSGIESKDTMLGVNLGGAVRLRSFEYFVAGGVGYHMIDRDVHTATGTRNISDDSVGVNAQFGFDVRVSDTIGLFGVGRFDLVQTEDSNIITSGDKSPDDEQTKVYLGVRFHF
jgi:outer membrane protein W